MSAVMVLIGVAMLVLDARARRGTAGRSGVLLGLLFVAAGAGRLYLAQGRAARCSAAASGSRRSSRSSTPRSRARSTSRSASSPARARPHAVRLPRWPACSSRWPCTTYVEGASLHQDRGGSTVFARYAFNELVELRRRLDDPARLHHPDRGHGVLGDELPGRVLGAAGPGPRRAAAVLRDHRLRRGPQRARLLEDAREPDRRARRRRPRAAGARSSSSGSSPSSTSTRSPTPSTSATRRRGGTPSSRSGWRP